MSQVVYMCTCFFVNYLIGCIGYVFLLTPRWWGRARTWLVLAGSMAPVLYSLGDAIFDVQLRSCIAVPAAFALVCVVFRDPLLRKLLVFALMYGIEIVVNALVWPIVVLISGAPSVDALTLELLIPSEAALRIPYWTAFAAGVFLVIRIWRLQGVHTVHRHSPVVLACSILLAGSLVFLFSRLSVVSTANDINVGAEALIGIMTGGSLFMLFAFFRLFREHAESEAKGDALLNQRALQARYLRDLADYIEVMAATQTSFSQTLSGAENIIARKDASALSELLDGWAGSSSDAPDFARYAPSVPVGSIIAAKSAQAQAAGIQFTARGLVDLPCVPEFDTSVIVSNLLDNALGAAQLSGPDASIELSCMQRAGLRSLVCKNTCPPNNAVRKKGHHQGLGLHIVSETAQAWHGTLYTSRKGRLFTAIVSFPVPDDAAGAAH